MVKLTYESVKTQKFKALIFGVFLIILGIGLAIISLSVKPLVLTLLGIVSLLWGLFGKHRKHLNIDI